MVRLGKLLRSLVAFASFGGLLLAGQTVRAEDEGDEDEKPPAEAQPPSEPAPPPQQPPTDKPPAEKPPTEKPPTEKPPAAEKPPAGDKAPAESEGDEAKKKKKNPKDDDVRSQGSNKHLHVVARSLKLTKTSRERLVSIAARYHAATGKKLVITGGDRDAKTQAKLMFKKMENDEDLLALYVRTDLVKPIISAYEGAKGKKKHSERTVIGAMAKVIQAQIDEGEFVSRHLEFSAADVRSRDLRDAEVDALRAAVRAEAGAQLVDERDSTAPHLHLNL